MVDLGLLRCIWQTELSHPAVAALRLVEADAGQILVCVGCGATFLVKDGIPIMLDDQDLSEEERRLLRSSRHAAA
jgi:uncharacterized protein YbaR (Trm112 family)